MTAPSFAGRLDEADLSLPERPLVSIVISAPHDERSTTQLLESLDAQTYGPESLEVLVAGGGSADRTRQLVRAFPSRFARLDVVGSANEAMRRAIGHCWVIVAAHSRVEPGFVEQSVAALRRTGAACVGGPVDPVGEGMAGSAIAAAMSSPFGLGDDRSRDAFEETEVDSVPLGCYHRQVWELVGEFDETVDAAADDSYDLRVIEAGGRIVLIPEIRSSYYPRQTFEALAKQYWGYGAAKGRLLGRGRPVQPRYLIPSAVVIGAPVVFLLSRRFKLARWAARGLGTLYFSRAFKAAGAAAEEHGANTFVTFAALATMHVTFGAGFIKGAVMERLGR